MGCIVLDVSMSDGCDYFTRLYKPDTLKEDFEAETLQARRNEQELLKDWLKKSGTLETNTLEYGLIREGVINGRE